MAVGGRIYWCGAPRYRKGGECVKEAIRLLCCMRCGCAYGGYEPIAKARCWDCGYVGAFELSGEDWAVRYVHLHRIKHHACLRCGKPATVGKYCEKHYGERWRNEAQFCAELGCRFKTTHESGLCVDHRRQRRVAATRAVSA